MNKKLLYCIMRNVCINYNNLEGDFRDIDSEIIYATTDVDELCEQFNIADKQAVVNNELHDLIELEGFEKDLRITDVEDNVHIKVFYYVDYREVDLTE